MSMVQRSTLFFDSHCHLQDPRIAPFAPKLIQAASQAGVRWFAVNGTSEEDWEAVRQMGEVHHEVIPCFGLHPWYVEGRSSTWLERLRSMFDAVPNAAVGEVGLDKGARGRAVDIGTQVHVLRQQLALAREVQRPVAVHCVRAFGELQETLKEMGTFPAGVILHSYLGSAEMVKPLVKQGAFFSFSGFLTTIKPGKAKKMLEEVPLNRILFETDAPDALPQVNLASLNWVPGDPEAPSDGKDLDSKQSGISENIEKDFQSKWNAQSSSKCQALNHPANISSVLKYVSSLLGMAEDDLAKAAYNNAVNLFSYPGSKVDG